MTAHLDHPADHGHGGHGFQPARRKGNERGIEGNARDPRNEGGAGRRSFTVALLQGKRGMVLLPGSMPWRRPEI